MLTYILSKIDSRGSIEIKDSIPNLGNYIDSRDICLSFVDSTGQTLATSDMSIDDAKYLCLKLGNKVRELEEKKNAEMREANRIKLLSEPKEI